MFTITWVGAQNGSHHLDTACSQAKDTKVVRYERSGVSILGLRTCLIQIRLNEGPNLPAGDE